MSGGPHCTGQPQESILTWDPTPIAGLELLRTRDYSRNRGLFLAHTWVPSQEPGQQARVTARLVQHGSGPLTWRKIESVEYVWGRKFSPQSQVMTDPGASYACAQDLYKPLLLIAKVSFNDGTAPLILTRYLNYETPADRTDEGGHPGAGGNRRALGSRQSQMGVPERSTPAT